MDGGTNSQMARYLSLSIMLYYSCVAKLATCTGLGRAEGTNPAPPGRLSLVIRVWRSWASGGDEGEQRYERDAGSSFAKIQGKT